MEDLESARRKNQQMNQQAQSLEHIVDDHSVKEESITWAAREFCNGRTSESLLADLTASGWSPEEAEFIVEEARQRTRSQRGVTTRDQVAAQADARYRRAMRSGWFMGRGGLIGVALNFFVVLWDFLAAWKPRKRQ